MKVKLKGMTELNASLKKHADPEAIRAVVKVNGTELQAKAMREAPVDTGNLKRSIMVSFKEDGMTAVVEALASYAPYQEYGTRFMNGHPFMRPSFNLQKDQFVKDLSKL